MSKDIQDILIHIGYHKTASTWLQRHLFIQESPYFLPLSRKGSGHSSFSNGFIRTIKGPVLSPFATNEEYLDGEWASLHSMLQERHGRWYVVSNERLAGSPENAGLDAKAIADRLKHYFPNGKILIMIREQRSFILSNYFEYLQQGGVHGIKRYLHRKEDLKRPHFAWHHVDYLPLIRYYDHLFGEGNVVVHTLEEFKQDPQGLLKALSRITGMSIQLEDDAFARQVNVKSQHFSRYRYRYLNYFIWSRSVNHYSPLHHPFAKRLAVRLWRLLGALSLPSWDRRVWQKLEQEVDRYCADRYTAGNEALAVRLGMDLKKFGYR